MILQKEIAGMVMMIIFQFMILKPTNATLYLLELLLYKLDFTEMQRF